MADLFERRQVLGIVAGAGSMLVGGCVSGSSSPGSTGSTSETPGETVTSTAVPTSTATQTETSESSTTAGETDSDGEAYTFGLAPIEPTSIVMETYAGFESYLDDAIGETDLDVAPSSRALVSRLESGSYAFADAGPLTAALAARDERAEIALQRKAFGTWEYESYIVTREETDLESLADVSGRSVVFANRFSTSGSIVPLWVLANAGVDVGALPLEAGNSGFEATFTNHAAALETLQAGDADVACLGGFIATDDDGSLEEGLRVLHAELELPRAPILTSPTLSPADTDAFVDAMRNAPDRAYAGADENDDDDDLWFSDVRPADPSDYEFLADAADTLDIELADL